MSDAEERKLWRIASEHAPDVVRWVETRLRRGGEQTLIEIPKFTHSFSEIAFIDPYGVRYITLNLPRHENDRGFQLAGMSLLVSAAEDHDVASIGMQEVRITINYRQQISHPASVLLVPHMDPPFKPGWLIDQVLPPCSTITLEITNASLKNNSFRFAVHGSYLVS